MGPEEHGGHCELEFDGLEVHDDDVFGGIGNGLRVVQVRLGPARLTHCMRWLELVEDMPLSHCFALSSLRRRIRRAVRNCAVSSNLPTARACR